MNPKGIYRRQPVAKVGVWAAVAFVIGMAAFDVTYGTVSPCGAVRHIARDIINHGMAEYILNNPPPEGAMGALGYAFGMKLIEAAPIEAMVDQGITKRFGATNPLTCTAALVAFDWDSLRKTMMKDAVAQSPNTESHLPAVDNKTPPPPVPMVETRPASPPPVVATTATPRPSYCNGSRAVERLPECGVPEAAIRQREKADEAARH
jgi:hypothetical protein